MDQVPVPILQLLERDILSLVLSRFPMALDTLLLDATNFFTFIASTDTRIQIAARGKQKLKRNDLGQIGVAVLCSRTARIPLWHCTYGRNIANAKSFATAIPLMHQRLAELGSSSDSVTILYDKGNVSKRNQALVDAAGLHYVSALTVASQKKLVQFANPRLETVLVDGEPVRTHRTRHSIWGKQRTVVVLVSERLLEGQARGVLQHVASAQKWLTQLADVLARGQQRRDRARIQRDIEAHLHGRQFLSRVLHVELRGDDSQLRLTHRFDQQAFDSLTQSTLGRIVLVTDREQRSTEQILSAYRSQAYIDRIKIRKAGFSAEEVFFVAVRITSAAILSAVERDGRRRAIGSSIGSFRIEGVELDPEVLEAAESYARGDISRAEMDARIDAFSDGI